MTKPKTPPIGMRRALNLTHDRFTYTADRFDNWRFPTMTGRIKDDCDGFAPAVLLELAGGSRLKFWIYLITFRATLWHVKTKRGRGHLVLRHRGWWCDNTRRRWYQTNDMEHRRMFPWPWPVVVWKYALGAIVRGALRLTRFKHA